MSSLLENKIYCTPAEYLAAEHVAEEKHEYLAGVIYAMSGATVRHNLIAVNITAELHRQLRGKRCAVYTNDLKVRICHGPGEFFYCPDVIVDCSSLPLASHMTDEPTVIFEVLSPQTERIDRGEKLQNY